MDRPTSWLEIMGNDEHISRILYKDVVVGKTQDRPPKTGAFI